MPYHRPIPEARRRGKTTPGLHALVEAEKMIQIAILMPVTAVLGWLLGAWLDGKLHQQWIGVAGILIGGVAGLAYVIRLALAAEKKTERESTEKPAAEDDRNEGRGKTERQNDGRD
ncbi:MAG TPA: AtpZ/AtpI family protein [Terracidiphilus sp.]|nr:AtpZ/AtpI family protein [Terracidiphilus sp.]